MAHRKIFSVTVYGISSIHNRVRRVCVRCLNAVKRNRILHNVSYNRPQLSIRSHSVKSTIHAVTYTPASHNYANSGIHIFNYRVAVYLSTHHCTSIFKTVISHEIAVYFLFSCIAFVHDVFQCRNM